MSARIRASVSALTAYTPGEQPRDPSVIKLNTNENPYPASPRVLEAIQAFALEDLRRYPDPVCSGLRRRLAEIHQVGEDCVFVGNGSDEVLALCTRVFTEHGGRIGYFDPSYSLYPVLADIDEAVRAPVALGADFEWCDPPDNDCSLFFLANPNAPTGMLFPEAEVQAFCERFRGVVVIDEAYVDFADRHAMDLARTRPNVLVARTLSKSFSLAGLRLGYAIGPAALIGALFKIKDSYNVDAFSQSVALAALSDLPYMQANAARVRATRERVRAALLTRGHRVFPSQTNFLWMQPSGRAAKEVFEALHRMGIVTRWFSGARTGAFLRVTISTDTHMDRFLEGLAIVMQGKAT